jgi:hypothetical protein
MKQTLGEKWDDASPVNTWYPGDVQKTIREKFLKPDTGRPENRKVDYWFEVRASAGVFAPGRVKQPERRASRSVSLHRILPASNPTGTWWSAIIAAIASSSPLATSFTPSSARRMDLRGAPNTRSNMPSGWARRSFFTGKAGRCRGCLHRHLSLPRLNRIFRGLDEVFQRGIGIAQSTCNGPHGNQAVGAWRLWRRS